MSSETFVKLKPMHGFMHGFFSKLSKFTLGLVLGLLIASAISYYSAYQARSTYRDYLNFNGEKPEIISVEELLSDQESDSDSSSESLSLGNEYLDSALDFAYDAKDWTSEQLKDNPLTDAYDKLNQDYLDLRYKILKIGDLISFWLSFILTFLATSLILSKLNQLKLTLTQENDPVVEENIQRLAKAVNELHQEIQAQKQNSNPVSPNPLNPNLNG